VKSRAGRPLCARRPFSSAFCWRLALSVSP
jgi:hypothetical protein